MEKTKQQKAKDFIINNGVIIVMFILVIYTGLTSDNFLTRNNLMNILMNMSSVSYTHLTLPTTPYV